MELLRIYFLHSLGSSKKPGFKVISVIGDGASQNRKIFRMHKLTCNYELNPDPAEPMTITHKVKNPYSTDD